MSNNSATLNERDEGGDNDSIASADSFVRDIPQRDIEDGKILGPAQSYFSPSSSTTVSEVEQSNHVKAEAMLEQTIDHSRKMSDGVGTIGSDSLPPIKPVHPFFSSSFYEDSDVSDGSIVFKASDAAGLGQPPPHQQQGQRIENRDRFPSFDSVGSSGSIRYVPPGSRMPPQAPSTNQGPQILPYHERRKLMEQRRKQQQNRAEPTPPRPERQPLPYMVTPNELAFFQSTQGNMIQQPLPPYQQFPGPTPLQHAPPNFPFPPPPMPPPMGPYPPFSQPIASYQMHQRLSPRSAAKHAAGSQRPPSGVKVGSKPPGVPQPPGSGSRPPMQPPVVNHILPSSSVDSSEIIDNNQSGRKPPPPPPPPIPSHFAHVRQDSSGSVSSLGSLDRSGREDNGDWEGSKGGFFQRLNPWHRPEPNIQEFHRRNQAFLSSLERQTQISASPMQIKRVTVASMGGPPPSRPGHRRLDSIEHDNWDDDAVSSSVDKLSPKDAHAQKLKSAVAAGDMTDDEADDSSVRRNDMVATETTRLLPPSGISSNEYNDRPYAGQQERYIADTRRGGRPYDGALFDPNEAERIANSNATTLQNYQTEYANRKYKTKKKHKNRGRRTRLRYPEEFSDHSVSSNSVHSSELQRRLKNHEKFIEREIAKRVRKEREQFLKQWEAEAKARNQEVEGVNSLFHTCSQWISVECSHVSEVAFGFWAWAESFLGNLPLTIGGIALAIANLGVVWFKFAEESMKSCEPVHFHSAQCTFPEFPGCFYCDKNATMYKVALNFHWTCSFIAGILALSFVAKLLIARRVVFDELSSPTTASPAGLICMALDVVFAGRGFFGKLVVSLASTIHLFLAIWFVYMALAYNIMPEPSWFPNTVGIGISAVKIWLYFPMAGHFLMAISLSLNFFFFPISLIRVAMNRKISATVGWMQMAAPSVSLYALTIMAQPSFAEEHPDINTFQKVHRMVYLPCMHFLFSLCIVGMLASVHSLKARWREFGKLPFSPAHAAFCAPTLSHANAIQAYRAAVNSFSDISGDSFFKLALYTYWILFLIGGSVVTLWISTKYLASLPAWTHIDVEGEIEPPAPYETNMTLSNMISTGETLIQPFVSPAILQANETGALVLTRNEEGKQRYVRTRKVTALGFEPIMDTVDIERERELLLEWVGKNPPRRRHRTLSVPGIDFTYGANLGTGNSGIYGMDQESQNNMFSRRTRANTASPHVTGRHVAGLFS